MIITVCIVPSLQHRRFLGLDRVLFCLRFVLIDIRAFQPLPGHRLVLVRADALPSTST
ncbi:hypothetical protein ACFOET_04880 [Parapedobacter deserti]|uniref:Uncharacterized protein n=1 Tax=Parapedobacter deserti TaxID=1912957 RepID=A0ABV7JKW7_9SPHI